MVRSSINKKALAIRLGISRSSLYYQPKRPAIDEEVKCQIESVLADHPAYGHKRLALALKMNRKRILRVMKKFAIKPYRRRAKKLVKKTDLGKPSAIYLNLLKEDRTKLLTRQPNSIWFTDFTFLRFHQRFIYLATIMDLATREIVGVNLSRFHSRFLVMGAYLNARDSYPPPKIIHSDQGSEYASRDFTDLATSEQVKISMSHKASPWQNGEQESFFGRLKTEAGNLDRFETTGELLEEIYRMIYYYNHSRIHGRLKMTPEQYRDKLAKSKINYESEKLGT